MRFVIPSSADEHSLAKQLEPLPSVTERTTELLFVETKGGDQGVER